MKDTIRALFIKTGVSYEIINNSPDTPENAKRLAILKKIMQHITDIKQLLSQL